MLKRPLTNNDKLRNLVLALALCFSCLPQSYALSTDKDQPIEVEADYAELDDEKGVTFYKGNVIVTQGSMKIDGDIMTATYTDEGDLDTIVVEGQPAHYEQLPDKSKIKDEAEALRMEFYSLKNQLVLIKKAVMKQEELKFTGDRIEYNTITNKVIAKGGSGSTDKGAPGGDSGRVKIILKQKKSP